MAAVTICSDFVAQENKICHCFNSFPIYLPGNDRTGCYDLFFWMMSFKPAFSFLGMIPVQFFPREWGLDLVRHTFSQKHRTKVMGHHFCDLPIKDQIPCIWNVLRLFSHAHNAKADCVVRYHMHMLMRQRTEISFWPVTSNELGCSAHEELNVNKHVFELGKLIILQWRPEMPVEPLCTLTTDWWQTLGQRSKSCLNSDPQKLYDIYDIFCLNILFWNNL